MNRVWPFLVLTFLYANLAAADTDQFSIKTFGAGQTFLKFSVSSHGNVIQLESPEGQEHILVGSFIEGYAVCSDSADPHGFDIGVVESGFDAATIVQPGGPNTLPLTITRSTTDGAFSLKQTYAWDTTEKSVTVTMTVKNTSGGTLTNVRLARIADFDIDNDYSDDVHTRTNDSVDGVQQEPGGDGVTLLGLTKSSMTTQIEDISAAFPATTCLSGSPVALPFSGDGLGRVVYNLGSLAKLKSKTVKVEYIRH